MLFLKNAMGLCSAVIGMVICVVFRNEIVFRQQLNAINEKLFDA